MARNATVVLSATEKARGDIAWSNLRDYVGSDVEFTLGYVKRDGTESTLTGTVLAIVGATDDKRAVTLATEKGPRSANLWAIKSIA